MVHNTRVQPLVCAVSPANTFATPIPLRLTADAIMQDLAPVAPNRLLTPWLVVGCCWPSANTQPMKFGWAPSKSIMDCCTLYAATVPLSSCKIGIGVCGRKTLYW